MLCVWGADDLFVESLEDRCGGRVYQRGGRVNSDECRDFIEGVPVFDFLFGICFKPWLFSHVINNHPTILKKIGND